MLPDRSQCLALLEKAGCRDDVVEHVEAVARLALALAEHAPAVDERIVEAGALLHDIGRAFDQTSDHVPLGMAFLRDEGVDEAVVLVVARHMGAGITEPERRVFGWPPGVYVPQTLEERIVCHADNLTFATRHVLLADVEEKARTRQLDAMAERARALHFRLAEELGVDPDEVSRGLAGT